MSETLWVVILTFDSASAIVLFSPAMVVVAIWHEIRERRWRSSNVKLRLPDVNLGGRVA